MMTGKLYDLDGVVLDSEIPERDACMTDLLQEFGGVWEYGAHKMLLSGKPLQECMQILVEVCKLKTTPEVLLRRRREQLRTLYAHFELMPNFPEFYHRLNEESPGPNALASGCDPEFFDVADQRFHLQELFEQRIYFSAALPFLASKPAPDIFAYAARKIGVEPTDCLVFEDAPNGVVAGWAAGARVVGFAKTFGEETLLRKSRAIAAETKTREESLLLIPDFSETSFQHVLEYERKP